MKIVIDVNLSRRWLNAILSAGLGAVYWSDIGNEEDDDELIMAWARDNDSIVLTCDLDFNAMLAASGASKPSVVQLRPGKHRPELLIGRLALALKTYQMQLETGALLTIDFGNSRVSKLPLVEIEYGTEF
jgi:predicted nuclease of predicted toxin-antitoxin system